MERIEAIESLKDLLSKITELDSAYSDLQRCKSNMKQARTNSQSKLFDFDREHKTAFVQEKIGPRPKGPSKKTKLAPPVYLVLLKKYKKKLLEYEKLLPLAEAAYREKYAEERKKLAELDSDEQKEKIRESEIALQKAKEKYSLIETEIKSVDLLSKELQKSVVVKQLINYLENNRADTLKEAVNLWFDEKRKDEEAAKAEAHRKEMKLLEEERVRAAKSAEEAAKSAEDYAMLQYLQSLNTDDKS